MSGVHKNTLILDESFKPKAIFSITRVERKETINQPSKFLMNLENDNHPSSKTFSEMIAVLVQYYEGIEDSIKYEFLETIKTLNL